MKEDGEIVKERARSLYSQLPESEKKRLCLDLSKTSRDLWKAWVKRAGLDKNGHRQPYIAKRELKVHRSALDRVLFEGANSPWEMILANYFLNIHPGLVANLHHEAGSQEEPAGHAMDFDHARRSDPEEPVKELFSLMAGLGSFRLAENGSASTGAPAGRDPEVAEDSSLEASSPVVCLRNALASYDGLLKRCADHLAVLSEGIPPTDNPVEDFRKLVSFHAVFREQLAEGFERTGRTGMPKWKGIEEATHLVDELVQDPLFDPPVESEESRFWKEVAQVLEQCRSRHRLPRLTDEFIETRKRVVAGLQQRLTDGAPPPLPPHAGSSGLEWIEKTVRLSGEDLEHLDCWFSENGFAGWGELLDSLEIVSEAAHFVVGEQTGSYVAQAIGTPLAGPSPTTVPPTEGREDLAVSSEPDDTQADAALPTEGRLDLEGTGVGGHQGPTMPVGLTVSAGAVDPGEIADVTGMMPEAAPEMMESRPPKEPGGGGGVRDEHTMIQLYDTVESIARETLARLDGGVAPERTSEALAHLGWHLLAAGEPALAWWAVREAGCNAPRPALLEMLTLVHWSAHQTVQTGDRISLLSAELVEEEDDVLSLAACLLPALLKPESHASQCLEELGLHAWPAVRALRETVVDFTRKHIPLTAELLDATRSHVEVQNQRSEALRRLDMWWRQASQLNIISLPARDVWRHWLGHEGWLSQLVGPLIGRREAEHPQRESPQEILSRFRDKEAIGREAERTYGSVLNHRGNLIVRAREQIVRNALEGVSLVAEWLRTEPSAVQGPDFREVLTKELRQKLTNQLPEAIGDVERASHQTQKTDVVRLAGWRALRKTLEMLQNLLQGGYETRAAHDPEVLLSRPLLRCPGIELDAVWQPVLSGRNFSRLLCETLQKPLLDWPKACEAHLDSGDLLAFGRCLALAREELPGFEAEISALETAGGDKRRSLSDAVHRKLAEVEGQLDDGLRQGLYNEQDYREIEAALRAVERDMTVGEESRFQVLLRRLSGEQDKIALRRSTQQHNAEKRLDALLQQEAITIETEARIREAIGSDLITAVDFLERAEHGDDLPPLRVDSADPFASFFCPVEIGQTSTFSLLCKHLLDEARQAPAPRQMPDWIRRAIPFAGLQHGSVAKPQREEGARFLETWLEVKQKRDITAHEAVKLLSALGFEDVHVTTEHRSGRRWLDVRTRVEADRQRCPLPAYGSEARGRYRVWCVWTRPSEEDIINAMEGSGSEARIIFHFGSLAGKNNLEQPRRDMARRALERRRRFLFLDDVLAVFLASEGAPRLRSFIACAAPFSHNEPYSAIAGQVPPEMFYGREWEMDQILSPRGSSFMYGGRQLGKTVLLRNAVKAFHHPESGHVACWVDLKDKGLGTAHSPDKLWEVLGTELKAVGVLPHNFRPTSRPEAFLRDVGDWLSREVGRRILFLLDEADDFLNADGVDPEQEFHRCSLLKGLMDRTDRRFKVVFAGLHNVQRSTRTSNQPLAHFGEPLCIGPMLRGEEAKAAADLVERPLRACGIALEPTQRSQIVTRVLARTNYYPSLIQLFCQKLVEHCFNAGRNRFDHRSSPPWRLTLEHVKAAEKLETVRQGIREKFILTLDLDKRFRLIAFLMAHHDGDHAGGGFHVQEIARKAREWWPAGFASSRSDDVFRDLLEEMVGLGVLRRGSDQVTYALRSPNLVSLLGSADEVEAELLSSINWEVKAEYDPQHFHQTLDASGMERSPFTAHQEARLFSSRGNFVAVVSGCSLAGLTPEFASRLRALAGKTPFAIIQTAEREGFERALRELSNRAEPRVVISVLPGTPWTFDWLHRALEKLSALKSEGKFVTVLFTQRLGCPPMELPADVESVPLGPWHNSALTQWFERASLGGDEARHPEVLSATGGWPTLVSDYLLARQSGRSVSDACASLQLRQERDREKILKEFGIDPAAVHGALEIAAELAGHTENEVRLLDIQEFADISSSALRALLRPLEVLEAVTLSEQKIRLNPVLARCLRAGPQTS